MKFKVLRGKHVENGVIYGPNTVVDSKSNLLRLNAPGAIKFELVGEEEPKGKTLATAQERGRSTSPVDETPIPVAAPGGQVSTGFQGTPVPVPTPSGFKRIEDVQKEQQGKETQGTTQQGVLTKASTHTAHGAPVRNKEEYHAELEKMTVADLKKHAEEEEYDLKGTTTKAEMIKTIKDQSR